MKGIKQLILSCMLGVGTLTPMQAQQVQGFVHEQSKATDYVWPTDQQVLLDEEEGWGYSCLTLIDRETIGILYESSVAHMTFQKVRIKDLLPTP